MFCMLALSEETNLAQEKTELYSCSFHRRLYYVLSCEIKLPHIPTKTQGKYYRRVRVIELKMLSAFLTLTILWHPSAFKNLCGVAFLALNKYLLLHLIFICTFVSFRPPRLDSLRGSGTVTSLRRQMGNVLVRFV